MNLNPFGEREDPQLKQIKEELSINREANQLQFSKSEGDTDAQFLVEQQKERAELTRWQQDMGSEIEIMIHRLKNEVNKNNNWIPILINDKPMKPMCSEECIWRLVALIQPSTSKNLMMSRYDKDQILDILRGLSYAVAFDILLANRKSYEIKMSDMTPILKIFQTAAEPTYFRALQGNEKTYLGTIRKDSYIHSEGNMQPTRKKLFGVM